MASAHQRRLRSAASSLEAATAAFLAFLDRLPDAIVCEPLPGGWTPAGHASHLALTNDVFLGVIQGGAGCSGPIAPFEGTSDFSEVAWHMDAPPSAIAPSILIPPLLISRERAAAHLAESAAKLRPAIDALDSDTATLCVRLPWAVVSLSQMSEWASGHTVRHLVQVNRELQIAAMRGMPAEP